MGWRSGPLGTGPEERFLPPLPSLQRFQKQSGVGKASATGGGCGPPHVVVQKRPPTSRLLPASSEELLFSSRMPSDLAGDLCPILFDRESAKGPWDFSGWHFPLC